MRTILLLLALLAIPHAARADDAAPSDPAAQAPAAAVPATVVEHVERVVVDGGLRLTRTVAWTVRIEDPARCAAGLIAPPGLDGATDAGAAVFEDTLVLPPDVAVGDTFTLRATARGRPGGHSGVFASAPDLPVETAVLEVRAPSWLPLHVWFDGGGAPEYASRGGRAVTVTWRDLPAGGASRAVYSTWRDWMEPGEDLVERVDRLLAGKEALGRELAADIVGLDVPSIVERVDRAVPLEPGPVPDWSAARPAVDAIRAGRGSAVDRGVLLLSLLRLAGHDAAPGLFRPSSQGGAFPVSVPAPGMLPRPVVVIRDDDGTYYVDPASPLAAVPDLPAAMAGGAVWEPGDLPKRLRSPDLVDGTVTINGNLAISGDGSASWSATISASGTASERLRELLAPLDEAGRAEALRRLARAARPDLQRFTVTASGVERPDRRLKISVSGHDDALLSPLADGLAGEIPVLLAPAMAAWLPPNIRVRETLAINPPGTVQVLGVDAPPSAFADEALVSRTHTREGQRQVLTVEVERPYRATSPAIDTAARSFLDAQSREGFDVLLFAPVSNALAKRVRSADLPAGERAILEALLWWSAENDRKATKALQRAGDVPLDGLVGGVERWVEPGRAGPWRSLATVAEQRLDPAARLRIARGMEAAGLRREAWLQAASLGHASDPAIRGPALLMMERLQDERPDPSRDPVGNQLWREPPRLLALAVEAAPDAPEVVVRRAELALAAGQAAEAEAMLAPIVAGTDDPGAAILLARAGARSGAAVDDVLDRVRTAVARAPHDPDTLSLAADALAEMGRHAEAARYALTAARLAGTDPARWSEAAALALRAGDAPSAGYAARRASDLAPGDVQRARDLVLVAGILADRDAADLGRARAGDQGQVREWPPSVDALAAEAPHALYAILVQRDAEVVADARLLALRAQQHIEHDQLDEAARDGVLLAARHDRPEGHALAFAATAGRMYSSIADRALDRAVDDDMTARLTRMEYRLITGTGDAAFDARALDDPRAALVARLRVDPASLAAEIEGWPTDLVDPRVRTPRGFRPNRLLGAAPGVVAWSDPDGATAILRVGAVTGTLPPPLANLYAPAGPPVRSRPDGARVLRLEGGVMPLFAAIAAAGEHEVLGVGFTPEAAERALDAAIR